MAMLDVAMILMASHLTGYLRNGKHPKPNGNKHPHATNSAYQTKDGLVMLGASNLRQQKRLWTVLERPDMIKRTQRRTRRGSRPRGRSCCEQIMLTRTAAEWEDYLQSTPRSRCARAHDGRGGGRSADRLARRAAPARLPRPGIDGAFSVPVAAFTFAHDGPRIDTPPPMFGQHNDEVLGELGYSAAEIAGFRAAKVI